MPAVVTEFTRNPLLEAAEKEGIDLDFASFENGEEEVRLDGWYTVKSLEFLVKWLKEHSEASK